MFLWFTLPWWPLALQNPILFLCSCFGMYMVLQFEFDEKKYREHFELAGLSRSISGHFFLLSLCVSSNLFYRMALALTDWLMTLRYLDFIGNFPAWFCLALLHKDNPHGSILFHVRITRDIIGQ